MVPTTEDFTSKNTIKIIEGIEEVILYGIREGLSDCNYNPNFDDDYTKKEIDDAVNVLKKYRPLKSLAAVYLIHFLSFSCAIILKLFSSTSDNDV